MIDTWDALLGPGVKPHPMAVYSEKDIEWLVDPGNLAWMVEHRIGLVVFDENTCIDGATPVDGRYVYRWPKKTRAAQDALRAVGIKIIGYMGVEWTRDAKKTGLEALAHIDEHGWDGVYADNLEALGATAAEILNSVRLLKARGKLLFHHASMEPLHGAVTFRGPWAKCENYVRQGEQGTRMAHPATIADRLWLDWISQVLQPGSAIGVFKAGCYAQEGSDAELVVWGESPWYDTARHSLLPIVYLMLPRWGCTVYVTRGNVMRDFERLYFPAWRREQAEFQADPAAFRAAARERFGVKR